MVLSQSVNVLYQHRVSALAEANAETGSMVEDLLETHSLPNEVWLHHYYFHARKIILINYTLLLSYSIVCKVTVLLLIGSFTVTYLSEESFVAYFFRSINIST